MGRWEPKGRDRLEQAALELFDEHGFEQTTVSEIAGRAGLTERTFFRHFADKREVLFGGSGALQELLVEVVSGKAGSVPPIEAVAEALDAAARVIQERPEYSRRRYAVITGHALLQERELIKLATLGTAIATTLRDCGVPAATASLTAEAGIAVFRVAYEQWVSNTTSDFADLIRESFVELRAVTAGR